LKYKKFEPYILEIIDTQRIPTITRIVLAESKYEELIIVIFTKNYLRTEFETKVREKIQSDIENYMGIEVFLIHIDKDPSL
jgi:hypothetical protein